MYGKKKKTIFFISKNAVRCTTRPTRVCERSTPTRVWNLARKVVCTRANDKNGRKKPFQKLTRQKAYFNSRQFNTGFAHVLARDLRGRPGCCRRRSSGLKHVGRLFSLLSAQRHSRMDTTIHNRCTVP